MGTAPKDKGYDHIVLRHEVVATVQPKMEIDGDKTIITDAGTALDENGNTVNIVVDKDGNKYIKGDMVQYSYVGKTVKMGIRPENLHDEELFLQNSPDSIIDADVEVVELMGSETYLYLKTVDTGISFIARVDARSTSRAGDKIKIALDANRLHFFDVDTEATILNR